MAETKRVGIKRNAGIVETPVCAIRLIVHSPKNILKINSFQHIFDAHAVTHGSVRNDMVFLIKLTFQDQ